MSLIGGLLTSRFRALREYAMQVGGAWVPRVSVVALIALSGITASSVSEAREVVDMVGRHVNVPDKVTKIYSTAPPTTLVVYAMKPETLIGWNFAPMSSSEDIAKFLDPRVAKLPILGSMMGHGQEANLEEVLAAKPDLVVAWTSSFLEAIPRGGAHGGDHRQPMRQDHASRRSARL
jgi:ABC-type Fe3+-hydroxamate transport system substrate-binding protein